MAEQHFFHRGSNGDIIYSLPTIIACGGNAVLHLRDPRHLSLLYRLLKLQSYIIDVNVDDIRKLRYYINLSKKFLRIALAKRDQHLAVSHLEAQGKTYDLAQSWLYNVEPVHVADIIINCTSTYHDKEEIDWRLLKPFIDRCKFVGYDLERNEFAQKYGMDIPLHKTEDALDVAQAIKGCKLFVGNQSLAFAIAEAMKHPRCLEVYEYYDNCQPYGKDGYTYLTKELIEEHLNASN